MGYPKDKLRIGLKIELSWANLPPELLEEILSQMQERDAWHLLAAMSTAHNRGRISRQKKFAG